MHVDSGVFSLFRIRKKFRFYAGTPASTKDETKDDLGFRFYNGTYRYNTGFGCSHSAEQNQTDFLHRRGNFSIFAQICKKIQECLTYLYLPWLWFFQLFFFGVSFHFFFPPHPCICPWLGGWYCSLLSTKCIWEPWEGHFTRCGVEAFIVQK